MTQIFAQLSAGQPGTLTAEKPPPTQVYDQHQVDVPVIGSEGVAAPATGGGFRAACAGLLTGSRAEMRNRLRVLQLLLTIGALATIRPQYNDPWQWATLLVLVHTFVFSFVLLWDKRCCGTIVRQLLPLYDWRALDLRYTSTVSLVLYVLFYGLAFSHKGYGGIVTCNWFSAVFSLLTALAYGFESWLQLRNDYDGRPSANN
ncbi:succinate dehydrogenase [Anopheles sinensis]|uniref:Succinate dehydrogenase n=1 Tax=Anopheles sinensis TaxID=74873 RepID=A0A084WPN7_ANOSI|nr:succinate dehydrogenase [Anopheles sinensis]